MAFGLRNAPATFQRHIDIVLAQAAPGHKFAYLHDILIFSDTLEFWVTASIVSGKVTMVEHVENAVTSAGGMPR